MKRRFHENQRGTNNMLATRENEMTSNRLKIFSSFGLVGTVVVWRWFVHDDAQLSSGSNVFDG